MNIQERLTAAFQAEHREHLQAVRAMLEALSACGFDARGFDFPEAYRRMHSLKGAARAVGLPGVERLSHRLETLVERCQRGQLALDAAVAGAVLRAFDDIEDWAATQVDRTAAAPDGQGLAALEHLLGLGTAKAVAAAPPRREPAPEPMPPSPGAPSADDTVRVSVGALDAVLRQSGEIAGEIARQDIVVEEIRRLREELDALRPNLGASVLGDILTRLKKASTEQADAAWRLRKLGTQLRASVRDLRIVPVESVFGGFRKVVRDLARDEGKEIEVEVHGLDMLADRGVLQQLRDPVLHLLRNAVSHGIEPASRRTAKGKAPAGRIRISAASERGRLVVRVEDDGSGLDRDRIGAEAVRRGLAAENIAGLLAQPGFSTAERLTEISGRGIGLSIVDRTARRMRGSFEISDATPYGTVATLGVPLTISAERVLTVLAGDQACCLPAYAIEQVRKVAVQDIVSVNGAPRLDVANGGEALPLALLSDIVGRSGTARIGDGGKALDTVILRAGKSRLALVVDDLGAVEEALVHDLEPSLANHRFADGAVVLRDGNAAFLLDPQGLVRAGRDAKPAAPADAAAAPRREAISEILVVDDSITTRTLERSILEATGYRVRLSTDGQDALEQLHRKPADLVIADIEMPRLDGFGLLHAVRNDPGLRTIPVILVTSRDDPEDRRKGLALGAQAYIVKQRFDQRDLLAAIEQIL